jgi:hypothetical protein
MVYEELGPMNRQTLRTIGMLCLLGAASITPQVGCQSASCEDICEKRNECSGTVEKQDCTVYCEATEKVAEASDCSDEYDALLSCESTVEVCTAETFCAGQNGVYLSCVNDACKDDPSKCSGG